MADGSIVIETKLDDKKAQAELNRLNKKIEDLNRKINTAQEKKMPLLEQAQELGVKLDEAKAKLESMRGSPVAFSNEQIKEQEETVKGLQSAWDAAQKKLDAYNREIERANKQATLAKDRANDVAQKIGGLGSRAPANVMEIAKSAISAATSRLISFGKAAAGVLGNNFKKSINFVFRGFKNIAASILKSAKNLNIFGKISGAVFGKVRHLGMMIRRVFVYSVITSGLRSARSELSLFLKSNEELQSSVARLKGAFLTAVEPIYSALVPAITKVVDLLTRAAATAAQFTSALFGKTPQQAKANAKALYEQAHATEEASEAAKKAEKKLLSFDEIEKLTGEDAEEANKKIAGEGADSAKLKLNPNGEEQEPVSFDFDFDDAEVFDKLKSFFDKLKSLWANGEYFEFGKVIAEKFNDVVKLIDNWINGTFRPKGVKWAKIIAQVLNGLIAGWDAALTGKTLADGLNAVLDIINTFLVNFDAVNMGKRVGEAINGFFSNVDWKLLGKTFGNGWVKVVDYISAVLETTDWESIGKGISTSVNDWFETIDWRATGQIFANGLNAVVGFVCGAVNTLDWAKIGASIGQIVQSFFGKIDWQRAAQTFSSGINGILNTTKNLVGNIDWREIATNITNALNRMIRDIDFKSAGKALSDFMRGVLDFIKTAVANFDWAGLGKAIGEFIVSINWGKVVLDLAEIGAYLILGLLEGMLSVAVTIGAWIKENIVEPIINAFKRLFGIASPSTVMAEIGRYIIEGLKQGFISGITALQAAWTALWDKLISTAKNALNKMVNLIKEMISQIKNAGQSISSFAEKAKSKLQTVIDKAKSAASSIGSKISGFFGGSSSGSAYSSLSVSRASVPALASGAVIPPNREFLAVLGDQSSGRNIEAPESLLRQMAAEAASVNAELLRELIQAVRAGHVMEIDGMRFGRVVRDAYDTESSYAGKSFVSMR